MGTEFKVPCSMFKVNVGLRVTHHPPLITLLELRSLHAGRVRSRIAQSYCSGTGSSPPTQNGWHLIRRLNPIHMPLTAPCFSTACIAYSEQVGVNLQLGGKKGEMNVL